VAENGSRTGGDNLRLYTTRAIVLEEGRLLGSLWREIFKVLYFTQRKPNMYKGRSGRWKRTSCFGPAQIDILRDLITGHFDPWY